jgi:hypothetical protein
MPMRYFDLYDDVYVPGRWELDDPMDQQGQAVDDPYAFRAGHPLSGEGHLRFPIYRPGKPIDFSLAGTGATPVVSARVVPIFTELAPSDVQLIPVEVEGQPDPYYILNATRLIRCIDDARTAEVLYWMPEDERPEKTGTYRDVYGMRIDPAKVGEAKVFRTWGWSIVLIVSEDIKDAMEHTGVTGAKFKEV